MEDKLIKALKDYANCQDDRAPSMECELRSDKRAKESIKKFCESAGFDAEKVIGSLSFFSDR